MLTLRPAPNTAPEIPRPLVLALGGLAAAAGIGHFVCTPILPLMVEDLGMTKGAAGLLASANFLGYLAGVLLAATPTVPGSRRNWPLLSLIVSFLTTGAMAYASSAAAFLILRCVGGVLLARSCSSWLPRLCSTASVPTDGPTFSAVHFAGVGVGMALSAVLISSLAAWDTGWRSFWLASGLTSVFAVGIVASLMADRVEPTTATTSRPRRTNPRLAALVMAHGLFGFGYIITATLLVAIVHASAQVRALEPLVGLIVGLTAAPWVVLWTWVGDKHGLVQGFTLACGIEVVGFFEAHLNR